MIFAIFFVVFFVTYFAIGGLSLAAARAAQERISDGYHLAVAQLSAGNALFWTALYCGFKLVF